MANEVEWTYMSSVALETDGAQIANVALASAPDASMTSGNHGNWPLCDLVLYVAGFGSALAGWQVINVYRCDMDLLGGTIDSIVPSAAFKQLYVGSFPLQQSMATNSTGYIPLPDVPLSSSCYFYLENTTAQTLSTGWGVWCRPKSYIPGA
jgi:hypothetical protein